MDELQASSDTANQENGVLRAQVERLQTELREYRKRLSWMTSGGNGLSAVSSIPNAHSQGQYGLQNNEFLFDFPKFGDLPGSHLFNAQKKNDQSKSKSAAPRAPGVLSRENLRGLIGAPVATPNYSKSNSSTPTASSTQQRTSNGTPNTTASGKNYNNSKSSSTHDHSTSDSPSSSSDSHHSQLLSSNGTSPEPSLNSPPDAKNHESGCGEQCSVNGEESFCAKLGMACGNINNPIPASRDRQAKPDNTPSNNQDDHQAPVDDTLGLDWFASQNGGQFDPVLFGDWREPQDAVLSQDFGTFFNDAFPLPDLGSPSHNFNDVATQPQQKKDLISQVEDKADEEVVPGEDKAQMLSCTKIWYVSNPHHPVNHSLTAFTRDRLQSMEKFRNGEIDVDNLCSELRTKARCSEGGVVVNQQDVDDIMGRAK